MVREFGWSRTMVTAGNALSKLVVGRVFGFGAGWIVDRFGPRRLMMAGILMAGTALIGLGAISALWMFYFFYLLNALGYVCGGPLPNQAGASAIALLPSRRPHTDINHRHPLNFNAKTQGRKEFFFLKNKTP